MFGHVADRVGGEGFALEVSGAEVDDLTIVSVGEVYGAVGFDERADGVPESEILKDLGREKIDGVGLSARGGERLSLGFDEGDLESGLGQSTGGDAPDNATADDNDVVGFCKVFCGIGCGNLGVHHGAGDLKDDRC